MILRGTPGVVWMIGFALLAACSSDMTEPIPPGTLQLIEVRAGTFALDANGSNVGVPKDQPLVADFSHALDTASVRAGVRLNRVEDGSAINYTLAWLNDFKSFSALPSETLLSNEAYTLTIDPTVKGKSGETFGGITLEFTTLVEPLTLTNLVIGGITALGTVNIEEVPRENLVIEVTFSAPIDASTVNSSTVQILGPPAVPATIQIPNGNTLVISLQQTLAGFTRYRLFLSDQLKGENGEPHAIYFKEFYTEIDPNPVFPIITDDELLTLVQEQTFKYFWDFAHPTSGMARERNTSGDIVTTGGSGFGVMAILVGIQRGFVDRTSGVARLDKIVSFLGTADRFHGVWPHWMNGNTGDVSPFSANDNGGDLVETSFMLQGLLAARQFLNPADPDENVVIQKINALWETVEFDWYTQGGQNVLYWHWSPTVGWAMNHPIRGYNEGLIVYFLAAASPTHTITKTVYTSGWARNGGIVNNQIYYGYQLPLGNSYGGPLFFAHYSFLGLDPRGLSDDYADDYWTQNMNHSLINYSHCVANPNHKVGYSDANWGLTASDNESGYSAHSPTNDLGVITPTAALSSFPYTPVESMRALKFFYYTIGDRTWGPYGFYDAFNPGKGWYGTSYLAIDQGPIIVMIENYRSGMLWDLFMSAPEVQTAMTKLGFTN
jgi:hypothetical protein